MRQHSAWTRDVRTAVIIDLLLDRGAAIDAVSTTELKTRFGVLPHRQTALGLAIFDKGLRIMQDERVLHAQRLLIESPEDKGARLTDGDFFCLWVDRAKRWDRKFLDDFWGAALTPQNRWSFPPCYFRTARMLGIETKTRDGVLGVGLSHEMAKLRRISRVPRPRGRRRLLSPEQAGDGPVLREGEPGDRNRGRRDKS